MLTLRLTPNLEKQLEHYAQSTGLSKNAIISSALSQFLKTGELQELPVEGPIRESSLEEFLHRKNERAEQYKNAHALANYARTNAIFTKKPDEKKAGELTPGIYGRNVVVGFSDSFNRDGQLYVISRNLGSTQGIGTDSFHLYVTKYDDWVNYMTEVAVK